MIAQAPGSLDHVEWLLQRKGNLLGCGLTLQVTRVGGSGMLQGSRLTSEKQPVLDRDAEPAATTSPRKLYGIDRPALIGLLDLRG